MDVSFAISRNRGIYICGVVSQDSATERITADARNAVCFSTIGYGFRNGYISCVFTCSRYYRS